MQVGGVKIFPIFAVFLPVSQEVLVVLCTCPDEKVSFLIAEDLVSKRLAACVQVVPCVESVYEWQGKLERSSEVQLIIKTTRTVYAELEARLKALHPYELPECIALPVDRGSRAYLDWVKATVNSVKG